MAEEEQQQPAPEAAVTGPVADYRDNPGGGKLQRGGNVRPANPTPAEVSARARKRLYQVIPELNRIAHNRSKRIGKGKRAKLKRPYSTANQIRAISELRLLAADRSLSEAQVSSNLLATVAEIYEHFEDRREEARTLVAKIGQHWLRS